MFSFFLSFYRLIKIIILGIKNDKDFRFLLFFIVLLLFSSTIFYSTVEHWTIIDALYFSVMTMATVGYGDFVPSTDLSKIFTIVYAFLSIGSFVSFTAKTVKIIMEHHNNKKEKIQDRIKNR